MKKHALTLAVSLALPGLAVAAPPTGATFGDWTLNADDSITAGGCPTGYVCGGNPIADNNFLQREMTIDNGDGTTTTYFQTIIATDDAAAGETFSTESFVKTGATNGGIAAQQDLATTDANDGDLTASATLAIGDFNTGGEDQVILDQTVEDSPTAPTFQAGFNFTKDSAGLSTTTLTQDVVVVGTGTEDFSDSFRFVQNKDAAGTATGTAIDIVSGVMLNDPGAAITDQTFSFASRSGDFVTAAGGARTIGAAADAVTWVAGEEVQRVLVGQTVDNAGQFGYDRVSNITTATDHTVFDLASTGPFNEITPVDPFVPVLTLQTGALTPLP